jgi:hypothetical protein
MNKLNKVVVAIVALFAFASASVDARCGRRCEPCKPRCEKKRCEKPCAPKCKSHTTRRIVQRPCTKWVEVAGTCDHEICTTCTTCESSKCIGGCKASCANSVNPEEAETATDMESSDEAAE